jgi:hypothetical protein
VMSLTEPEFVKSESSGYLYGENKINYGGI